MNADGVPEASKAASAAEREAVEAPGETAIDSDGNVITWWDPAVHEVVTDGSAPRSGT